MRLVADLHVHSKYARATSRDNDISGLARGAKTKGIDIMATGDFTHPNYFEEIRTLLKEDGSGLYEFDGVRFIISGEISLIYGKRRMHHLILVPNLEIASQINDTLSKRGNLKSDGRPILGLSSPEFAESLFSISKDIVIIPAHAWTPWFSVFGSRSGVDTVEEAFEDQADRIFALETGLSCYDEETEVLTEDGWKKFFQVKYSDKICSLNPNNYQIEFQSPSKIYKHNYKGKMYRLQTKRVDLFITPNHNLFYRPCDFRTVKQYKLAEARSLFGKSKILKKDGFWLGKKPNYFTLPAVQMRHGSQHYSGFRNKAKKQLPIEPWLKFFGFWLAEGWTTEGKNGSYAVCVSNRDQSLLNEMKQILESFGYNVYQDKKTTYTIRVRNYQLFYYLKQFGKCRDKFIPQNIKSLSKELIEIFFDYYIKGDGHRYGRTNKGLSATTTSVRLRDDLQEIALKMGMSAYYKLHNKKGTPFHSSSQKKQYFQNADSWVIFFIRKNQHTILPSTIKNNNYIEDWEDFDGFVYCVTVPNHVIYVRRNGIPVWCGNSDPAMNWMLSRLDRYTLVSNSDAHSLDKLGREANVFELHEPSYKALINAIRTRDGFLKTYEFYPEEGKYHYDGHRKCSICWSPWESKKHSDVCTVCRKKVTVGVLHRVAELADRKEGFKPECAVPFQYIVPLKTVISKTIRKGENTLAVRREYDKLIKYFGNEFAVFESGEEQIRLAADSEIANSIMKVKQGNIRWVPGHDGVFGELILDEKTAPKGSTDKKQTSLGDF